MYISRTVNEPTNRRRRAVSHSQQQGAAIVDQRQHSKLQSTLRNITQCAADKSFEAEQSNTLQQIPNAPVQRAIGDTNGATDATVAIFRSGQFVSAINFGFSPGDSVGTLRASVAARLGANGVAFTITDNQGAALSDTTLLLNGGQYQVNFNEEVGSFNHEMPRRDPPRRGHRRTGALGQDDWAALMGH